MAEYPLLEFVEAIAGSNGTAIATTGPKKYGDTWTIRMFACSSDSATESKLRVYRGFESPGSMVASTYSGNGDTSGGDEIVIGSQEKILFVWESASPGARCTCRFEGTLNSGRR